MLRCVYSYIEFIEKCVFKLWNISGRCSCLHAVFVHYNLHAGSAHGDYSSSFHVCSQMHCFVLCAYKYFITFHLSSHGDTGALEINEIYLDSERHLCLSCNLYFLCLCVNIDEHMWCDMWEHVLSNSKKNTIIVGILILIKYPFNIFYCSYICSSKPLWNVGPIPMKVAECKQCVLHFVLCWEAMMPVPGTAGRAGSPSAPNPPLAP